MFCDPELWMAEDFEEKTRRGYFGTGGFLGGGGPLFGGGGPPAPGSHQGGKNPKGES